MAVTVFAMVVEYCQTVENNLPGMILGLIIPLNNWGREKKKKGMALTHIHSGTFRMLVW